MIVLTCRNNRELSKACLNTLLAQRSRNSVLIVDNASTDGTAGWARWVAAAERSRVLRQSYPKVVSVARMWNEALDCAWREGFERALVVNNDTELLPETCGMLDEFMRERRAIGMATCVSVRERSELVLPEVLTADVHPDFSCFMIARWVHRLVRFDESYKRAYGEDCAMHVEMHRAGIRAVNVNIPFLHHGSATVNNADDRERREIQQQADRNREYFFSRYGKRIGTVGYDSLFDEASFGMNKLMAGPASPLKV
jgi:hypothetical protein